MSCPFSGQYEPCSVWVARNNGPVASEILVANVASSNGNIPANFINDGCFNFRLYATADHTNPFIQMNVGHPGVCNADGTAKPNLVDRPAGRPERRPDRAHSLPR